MSLDVSKLFITRPVAASLVCLGLSLFGALAYFFLPVSPLPQIEFPVISVQATLPGASPQTVASSVTSPLEQSIGQISGVTEMTSVSKLSSTRINIMFDLSRDINGAARDVQSAITAAKGKLPANLSSQPSYRIVNPADSPILVLALTSKIISRGELYNIASSVLQQKLSQIEGVGQVLVGGGSLPAVRVQVNPQALNTYGVSLSSIKTTLQQASALSPKGDIQSPHKAFNLTANDQLSTPKEYEDLIINYTNNSPLFLKNVATVSQSVEDTLNDGAIDGDSAIVIIVFKQPSSNVIETNQRIFNSLESLEASIPTAADLIVVLDRSLSIRSSLEEVKKTLLLSVLLVAFTTFVFLGGLHEAIIASTVLPVALLGTFGIMYLVGFSLNNLTMMALTIATGFIIDDAVVVLENIKRHMENGMKAFEACIKGTKEVVFTVFSMSLSLIAVFTPLLLMPGIIGRLFWEFSATLSIAILLSMVLCFLLTPVLSSKLLGKRGGDFKKTFGFYKTVYKFHKKILSWSLRHQMQVLLITVGFLVLSIGLVVIIPKSFFPLQDTGRLSGTLQAQQDMSFEQVKEKFRKLMELSKDEPSIHHVVGFAGGANAVGNNGMVFFSLKPKEKRDQTVFDVLDRLREKFSTISGVTLYLNPSQEISFGARSSSAMYQFTLSSFDSDLLNEWVPKVQNSLSDIPGIVDLNNDQLSKGLEVYVEMDRKKVEYYGLTTQQVNTFLYNYFGQSQISTLYTPLNQYHVILEAQDKDKKSPQILSTLFITNSAGSKIPLSQLATFKTRQTLLQVTHQAGVPSATFSFNLTPGYSLGAIIEQIQETLPIIGLPQASIKANFQGTAKIFQDSSSGQSVLIIGAILAIYVVLGILYESALHPLTILSTLPTAIIGAVIGLYVMRLDLSIMGLIGVLLLIGIVKKNAIMMIDFALSEQRSKECPPLVAIHAASLRRFRPILMTTMAAILGALPLVIGSGDGIELRKPMGVSIIGGLLISQIFTLYTTPVIYLLFEKLKTYITSKKKKEEGQ